MLSRINTAAVYGLDALAVSVETDITRGLPGFYIVGLADVTVKEARERIRSAVLNSECEFPMERIVINIAPADIRKKGSCLDLPMAIGILAGTHQIMTDELKDWCFMGELSLDGKIRRVSGLLPMLTVLEEQGIRRAVVPYDNRKEAALLSKIEIYPARNLKDVVEAFNMRKPLKRQMHSKNIEGVESKPGFDFSEVKGRENAKRAIMIAVAGGHGLLMTGTPSTGKTMLAERIPTIMPPMSFEEIMEVTKIYSSAGLLDEKRQFITERPYRNPHHNITGVSLTGGGIIPKPGEITLAHKGVLFLDELAEFRRDTIDLLRQPLEEKQIAISRLEHKYVYPADFLLIAASNPCKCGYYGDEEKECTCTASEIQKYRGKISGPVMDRIDLHIRLHNIKYDELKDRRGMSSERMRKTIVAARDLQRERFAKLFRSEKFSLNGNLGIRQVDKVIILGREEESFLQAAYERYMLNPRVLFKIKKVARTIADIAGREYVRTEDLSEAIQYREEASR